jgi:hypothetical protein|tara:strand:+ start:78 stop:485 length:408 start_codon:yes stop_codon:yes gene_type:complete
MADAVSTQTIDDGPRNLVMKFTNRSDGTGETNVNKIDVSSLSKRPTDDAVCTSITISSIQFATSGMSVDIFLDATTNQLLTTLPADYADTLDFSAYTGLPNNAGSGKTGDILFSTRGHTNLDTYMVVITGVKNYG